MPDQLKAFETWYRLDRKLAETVTETGIKKDTLISWMRKFDWRTRADAMSTQLVENVKTAIVSDQTQVMLDDLELAQTFIDKTKKFWATHDIEEVKDAIQAGKAGIELKRKIMGLDEKQPDQTNIAIVSPDTLAELAIERALKRRLDALEA